MGREQFADGVQGVFRLAFLDVADHHVDQHRRQDHAGVDPMAEQGGHQRGRYHHVQQDVVELQQQPQQGPAPLRRRQPVGAVARQAGVGFDRSQAVVAALEGFEGRFGGQVVPGRVGLREEPGVHSRASVDEPALSTLARSPGAGLT
ncbi:hypothetical protein D3C84_931190 [compost metagenome]